MLGDFELEKSTAYKSWTASQDVTGKIRFPGGGFNKNFTCLIIRIEQVSIDFVFSLISELMDYFQ